MSAAITYKCITVKDSTKAESVNVTGHLLVIKEATARFQVQLDSGEKLEVEGGFSIRVPEGFTRLMFFNLATTNDGTNDLSVEFYAGGADVHYFSQYQRPPPTRLKPTATTIASSGTRDFLGVDAGNRRKSILVTNKDATTDLSVVSIVDNEQMAVIYPRSREIFETDADIRLKNFSGAGLEVAVAEIFYK